MTILDIIFPKMCLGCLQKGRYICKDCLVEIDKGGFYQNTISIFGYEGVIKKAIIALKYKYSTEVAKELADVCVKKIKSIPLLTSNNYLLIPIPLHWHRQNVRGFNQSTEVGSSIASQMGWKFIPDFLIRNTNTVPQKELGGEARRKNLMGVFEVNSKYPINTQLPVLLFDDVFTTGSTLNEATKVLIQAGIIKVLGLTIAR